jgi:hypothetical protein
MFPAVGFVIATELGVLGVIYAVVDDDVAIAEFPTSFFADK